MPGALHDVDFMVKDSKRFADSGGWGYAQFEYDPATETFRPGETKDLPPQEHDAKCGFACHTIVADKDYVFTAYPKREAPPSSGLTTQPRRLATSGFGVVD